MDKRKNELPNSFDNLKRGTDILKNENAAWQKDFNQIIKLRKIAAKLDKSGKYIKAIETYKEAIAFGENSKRLNISNYAHDIDRVIILYGKARQSDKQRFFLERIIKDYPDYKEIEKWKVRLSKISSPSTSQQEQFSFSDVMLPKPNKPTLGTRFQNYIDSLPEFNFYYDLPEGMQTFEYLHINNPVSFEQFAKIREFRNCFKTILNDAQIAENQNKYKKAIETYLLLIAENYEGQEPFERLIIIFNKLKWEKQLIVLLEKAINFFEKLRENQKTRTISTAKKYGMENKALEYIRNNQKIQYYGGAFDLYNPYPIIDKWKQRLEKNKSKKH